MTQVQLEDLQGLMVRGYRMPLARYIVLKVNPDNPGAAKRFIGMLSDTKTYQPPIPKITTGVEWPNRQKPDYCLNIAFTLPGLRALDVDQEVLNNSFDKDSSFAKGVIEQAITVGDESDSAPTNWHEPFRTPENVHIILSLFAREEAVLEERTEQLVHYIKNEEEFPPPFVSPFNDPQDKRVYAWFDSAVLPGGKIHFGYVDGISQPVIEGVTPGWDAIPDDQPKAPITAFLLGYEKKSEDPQVNVLTMNGSFGAFRMLKQDVEGFEAFLSREQQKTGVGAEMIAAKICGRWRNGNPLILTPDEQGDKLGPEKINDFSYANDPDGKVCPFASHLRRTNPRDTPTFDDGGHAHRILRRAAAYTGVPEVDPEECGLIGMFIGASLEDQFEFIMENWVNGKFNFMADAEAAKTASFNQPLKGDKDLFIGNNDTSSFHFDDPVKGNTPIDNISSFVSTRGSAYTFIPSMTAIRFIAGVTEQAAIKQPVKQDTETR